MSDFKKQYDKELQYQEIKSNRYTLNGVIMFIIMELIIWILNMIGLFEIDSTTITTAAVISIVLLIPIILVLTKCDMSKNSYKYIFLTFICISCCTFICCATSVCCTLQT